METDPTRLCALLVGLPDVTVVDVVLGREVAGCCAWFAGRSHCGLRMMLDPQIFFW